MSQERERERDTDPGRKTAGQDRQGRSETGRNVKVQCMAASEVCDVNGDKGLGGISGVDVIDNSEQPLDADSQVFRSTIIGSINVLKEDVSNLKDDMRQLKKDYGGVQPSQTGSCIPFRWLYVGVDANETGFGKTQLEALLGCRVVKYVHLENCFTNAFKVKIRQTDLERALESGHTPGCRVHVWKNSVGGASHIESLKASDNGGAGVDLGSPGERACDVGGHVSDLCISCWNCRGLWSSVPYIESLLGEGVKGLVLAEHWLWPFELNKLSEINDNFEAVGKADVRGSRGSGGI